MYKRARMSQYDPHYNAPQIYQAHPALSMSAPQSTNTLVRQHTDCLASHTYLY